MAPRSFSVAVTWDAEASVWYATSEDVPGLAAEAATPEEMLEKLRVLVPELLELNRHLVDDGAPPVSVNAHFNSFQRELQIV